MWERVSVLDSGVRPAPSCCVFLGVSPVSEAPWSLSIYRGVPGCTGLLCGA